MSRGPRIGGFAAWRRAHRTALADALGRLAARPFASLLTLAVLALAVALPLCLGGLVKEAQRFSAGLRESRDIAVFLDPAADSAAARTAAARWNADPRVAEVVLQSPEQGLSELQADRALAPTLAVLERNPLPWVLLVAPREGADDHALVEALRAEPGVDQVVHDAAWRERLAAWLQLARHLALLAAALLGAGLVLVVGNTVRLEIQDRSEEILTLRLLGATDRWVRRPFLYLGALYGGLAGAIAGGVTWLAGSWLAPPLARLVASYGGSFRLVLWSASELLAVAALAALLGMAGAAAAVGHHLRQSESTA
ncbi:permease-like cell division protein FtsX [Pseudomarimonas salicorniae]|uniref:Cell division protein FtsX n=1 Tax=Pseudomarimonas salicorniae TaxID=2933270 RepID=A0ABT0GCY8_9GAMM|nr:permease-like cell division protein FtsX [Lysobacter sp. CAU 1642]MCK7592404.1 permease-like cell division protein FtsX [Lysobacter sp. CAU 1642]